MDWSIGLLHILPGVCSGAGLVIHPIYSIFTQDDFTFPRKYLEIPLPVFQAWRRIFSHSLLPNVIPGWTAGVFTGGNSFVKWAILNHYRTSLPRLERIKATYLPLFLDIHRTVRRCWPNQGIPQHRPHLSWSGTCDGDCQPLPGILLQCCGEFNN